MNKIKLIVLLALLAAASAAHAHGGPRKKVTESIDINAPVETIWNIVKNFADGSWLSQVASTTATNGNAEGAVRELHFNKGGVFKQELKGVNEAAKTLKFRHHEEPDCAVFPTNNYSAVISVTPIGSGAHVEWLSAAYRCFTPNNPPPGQDEAAAVEAMTTFSKESLANLKKLAEGR